jgi:hypothetical protein
MDDQLWDFISKKNVINKLKKKTNNIEESISSRDVNQMDKSLLSVNIQDVQILKSVVKANLPPLLDK